MVNDYLPRVVKPRHGCMVLLFLAVALGSPASAMELADIRARYHALLDGVADNPFHAPVSVTSVENGDLMSADVYGVIKHPFAAVAGAISDPLTLCDFISLSINIKACTAALPQTPTMLNWYMGRKDYGEPDPDQAVNFKFTIESRTDQTLRARLHASQGLLGITDNIIVIDLAAVDGHTLVHFAASYIGSLQSRMAMGTYLMTFGRNKIGFTTYSDATGKPVPVKGAQGIIERNTMRYYLALQAWLDCATVAPQQRDVARIERWYDETERFRDQLYELPREEFIANKKRERLNQQNLQHAIDDVGKLIH